MDRQELTGYFNRLDRSFFMDNEYKNMALNDMPLPIGYGQTISQPTLVLEMTYRLSPDKNSSVLEIGTGSGYQTALLANFSKMVYTVEKIPELSLKAHRRLKQLGFTNIEFKVGDGSEGWAENAPFDRIMVTAAAQVLPQVLVSQLDIGGIMILPLGGRGLQDLTLITKDEGNQIHQAYLGKVTFVEMAGKYGWQ